ncbi:5-oxoprolinase subunit PxpB [Erwinia sp. B116]|uniref:5-oxoprolinase subunit PxpB n=1 Tax=Erwinia sp. B116 TaxID=1561024 RepID=UPI000C75C933|nr:5-oxoprolinase subunit PxpB [Erwinia sp. B116]PLV58236.1 hypothetical protein NV64_14360 [Erwinia sp. B116]
MQHARYYLLGERTAVLELEPPFSLTAQQRVWSLAQHLQPHPQVLDVVPGMNNLSVILREAPHNAAEVLAWLQQAWQQSGSQEAEFRRVDIPVIYGGSGGADLQHVARHHGLNARQVVEMHAAAEYVVCFIGFQPGFPYLAGLDPRLHTPRRDTPRVRVPAGSVAIGGSQTGIYPLESPGGWQLIGHTATALFLPDRQPPVLLRPGDRLRFVPQKEGVC